MCLHVLQPNSNGCSHLLSAKDRPCPSHGCTCGFCALLYIFTAHAFCASLLLNDTTHWLVQCRVSLCSHVMLCKSTICTGTSAHVTVYLLYHPYSVLCVACVFLCHMSANLPPGRPGLLPAGLWRGSSRDCPWTAQKRWSGPERSGWCEEITNSLSLSTVS